MIGNNGSRQGEDANLTVGEFKKKPASRSQVAEGEAAPEKRQR